MGGCLSRSHGKCDQNINNKYSLIFEQSELEKIGVKLMQPLPKFSIAFENDTIYWKIGNDEWNNCKKDGFAIAVLIWLKKIDHGLFDSKLSRGRDIKIDIKIYIKMLRYVTEKIKRLSGEFKSNCLRK